MTTKSILLSQLIIIVAWASVGTFLGVAGVFASSHIPVVVLGWVFGAVGACMHMSLVALGKSLAFWKAGCLISLVAGAVTIPWAPLLISQIAVPIYFIFGGLIYFVVNLFITKVLAHD